MQSYAQMLYLNKQIHPWLRNRIHFYFEVNAFFITSITSNKIAVCLR
jgi:hypothetical protein